MTTTVVKTVGSNPYGITGTGRDYNTAQLYDTYVEALNLVALDTVQEADFYNDAEFAVAGAVLAMAGGAVADATRFIRITTGAGQSFRDNANVRTNALYYNAANGIGLNDTASSSGTRTLRVTSLNFTTISNLQFKSSDNTAMADINSANMTIANCIFVGPEVQNQQNTVTFNNCLFVNTLGPFTRGFVNFGTGVAFNFCTFICAPTLANYVYNSGSATYTNCAFFGGGTSAFNVTTGTDTFSNCMTDITGTTGLTGGKTFANQFVSATNDFRAKSGADLANAGTPVGGITADISGFTRNASTPTIGAWELSSGVTVSGVGSAGAEGFRTIWYGNP